MIKACIILPVYNHPHYLSRLLCYLQQFKLPVILVDDGSDVACKCVIATLQQQFDFTLLQHAENQGKGQAVMTAIQYADQHGFSHALQLDVDGQHDWQDIARFLALAEQNPHAMIIGNPVFDVTVPKKRLYGRYMTHVWVWINALSLEIKDSMCGFRVYPVAATHQVIKNHSLQPRMGFDSEILVRLSWQGMRFINVKTKVIYPADGISHFQLWRDNWGISKTHARLLAGMLIRFPRLLKRRWQD